jgi:hypothetical protein
MHIDYDRSIKYIPNSFISLIGKALAFKTTSLFDPEKLI